MKKCLIMVITVIICAFSSISAFAAEPNNDAAVNTGESQTSYQVNPVKAITSTKSFKRGYSCGITPISKFVKKSVKRSSIRLTDEISKQKTKVETAYLKISGEKLIPVTLYYKTQNVSGHPQFVYEDTYVQWDFRGSDYAVDYPDADFSGDAVTFTFFAQMGLIHDSATVTFTP